MCCPAKIFYGDATISGESGVQQGDPAAPYIFAVGLHTVIKRLEQECDIKQLWYLDDGLFFRTFAQLEMALKILLECLPTITTVLNIPKTELLTTSDSHVPQSLLQFSQPLTCSLGSYLGSPLTREEGESVTTALSRTSAVNA